MTTEALRVALKTLSIDDLLPREWIGQGYGFKSYEIFENEMLADDVCYISEFAYDDILDEDYEFDEDDFYSRNDFITMCDDDVKKAAMVFDMCTWESPGCILDQWDEGDEEALSEMQ
mgnify:CR=1 FL=1